MLDCGFAGRSRGSPNVKIMYSVPPLYIYMQTRQISVAEWSCFMGLV